MYLITLFFPKLHLRRPLTGWPLSTSSKADINFINLTQETAHNGLLFDVLYAGDNQIYMYSK